MMSVYGNFPTKKSFKEFAIDNYAEQFFMETSAFGPEYKGDGTYCVVGPSPQSRRWFASVVVKDGKVIRIS